MIKFNESSEEYPQDGLGKYSDTPLDEYLLSIDRLIKEETESTESKIRAQTIIQMCRRYRGATPSDLFGFWRNGVWADSPKFNQLHGTNVFQALVHGAEAGFSQARISLDIAAKANNFKNRSVEKIARSIYEVLDKSQWTEATEAEIFFGAMLKLNSFAISRFNKSGGPKLPMPQMSPVSYQQGGLFLCPECGEYGDATEAGGICPACGAPVYNIQDPQQLQDLIVSEFGEVEAGQPELLIEDALSVAVDDRAGASADIEQAGWVRWTYFAQKAELKKLYPHLQCKTKPEWSYATRLKVALKRYESGEAMPKTKFEKQQYEVKQTWLDRTEYESFVSPTNFQLGNFSIAAGQRLSDVCPDGLVMGVVNNELLFVDAENKNRRVKTCVWLSDPTSFYGLGARAGLPIQKKINQLDNMAMEGEARSLKGSVVYHPEAIDGAHLEGANTNIPLKPDFATGGDPLKNFIMPIEVSGLSAASMAFLGTQVDTMQRVMGIPDVTLGEGDPQIKTATGQQLVSQRASGLLIPAKKSEATMKIGWLWDQLDIIQKFYSPEALVQFGSRYGEEWLEDEIQAFFDADLQNAITVDMVEGSEVPESRFEKQQKLRNDILAGFIPLTPKLQMKLAQQSGYDGIDVNDYESNCKLAEKRLNWIKEYAFDPNLEMMYQQVEMQLTDPTTGARMMDGVGNKIPNPVVTQVLMAPVLQINKQAENLQQQFDFWAEKTRQFMAAGQDPPQVVVAICDALMTTYKLAAFEDALKTQTLMGLTTAPIQVGGAMIQQAMTPPEEKEKSEKSAKKS